MVQTIILDKWQQDVLEAEGNLCICSGRQSGKSTVIGIKAGERACTVQNSQIMMIAAVERQAYLLFEKCLSYIMDNYPKMVMGGRNRPTKSIIRLKNGSVIRCLPTGLTGHGIRGYTIDVLFADEAHFIPEDVWVAVTPMLATTKGNIVLLSTPHGREGYFYRCFSDDSFQKFHVSSEECTRIDKAFLANEKKRMTKLKYAQEYLGKFVGGLMQFFPDELIKSRMVAYRPDSVDRSKDYYLGVDIARMGADDTVFSIGRRYEDRMIQVENMITKKTYLTDTTDTILGLEKLYDFEKIIIDDGGLGVGVLDPLLKDDSTSTKVMGISNAQRSLDNEDKRKKKIIKEDMYVNLKLLLEQQRIDLLDDMEIFLSLKSVQFEYTIEGNLKIYGTNTHNAESLIRMAYPMNEKVNKLWVMWS